MSRVNIKNRKILRMPVNLRLNVMDFSSSSPQKASFLNKTHKGKLGKNLIKPFEDNLNKTEDIINRAEEKIVSSFIDSLFDDNDNIEKRPKKILKNSKKMEKSPANDLNAKNMKNDNEKTYVKGLRKYNTSKGNKVLNKTTEIKKNIDLCEINDSEDNKIKIEMDKINKSKQLCEERLRKINEQISLLQKEQIEVNNELKSLQKKEIKLNNKLKEKDKAKEELQEKNKNQNGTNKKEVENIEENKNLIETNKKEVENIEKKESKKEKKEKKEKKDKKEKKEKKDKKDKKDKKHKKHKKENSVDKGKEAEDLIKLFNRNADMNEMALYPFA